jgi:hypothetical protein
MLSTAPAHRDQAPSVVSTNRWVPHLPQKCLVSFSDDLYDWIWWLRWGLDFKGKHVRNKVPVQYLQELQEHVILLIGRADGISTVVMQLPQRQVAFASVVIVDFVRIHSLHSYLVNKHNSAFIEISALIRNHPPARPQLNVLVGSTRGPRQDFDVPRRCSVAEACPGSAIFSQWPITRGSAVEWMPA